MDQAFASSGPVRQIFCLGFTVDFYFISAWSMPRGRPQNSWLRQVESYLSDKGMAGLASALAMVIWRLKEYRRKVDALTHTCPGSTYFTSNYGVYVQNDTYNDNCIRQCDDCRGHYQDDLFVSDVTYICIFVLDVTSISPPARMSQPSLSLDSISDPMTSSLVRLARL